MADVAKMSDLEITKLCAEAMKLKFLTVKDGAYIEHPDKEIDYGWDGVYMYDAGCNMWSRSYDPLHDDAQAMALVKRFNPAIGAVEIALEQYVYKVFKIYRAGAKCEVIEAESADLNRAICECVAKMQKDNQGSAT